MFELSQVKNFYPGSGLRMGSLVLSCLFAAALIVTAAMSGPLCARELTGPIHDAYMPGDSHLIRIVYSTGGDPKNVEMLRNKLQEMANWSNSLRQNHFKVEVIPDTDFKPEMFGKDGLQLIGPFEDHKVLKEYFSNTAVKVNKDGITIGDKQLKGDNLDVIYIWPQPGNQEYVIIGTSTSYAPFLDKNNGSIGHGDFIAHSAETRKASDKYSFELMGTFVKEPGKEWTVTPESFITPQNAKQYFIQRAFEQAARRKSPEAEILTIELKDGNKVRGKLLRGDGDNLIIKLYDSNDCPMGFMETQISSVLKADDSDVVCSKVYRPQNLGQMIYSYWQIVENRDIRSRTIVSAFNDKLKTIEFLPLTTTNNEKIEKVRDVFGNDMEFKTEKVPNQEMFLHTVRLNYPTRPGESLNIRLDTTLNNRVHLQENGKGKVYQLDQEIKGIKNLPFKLGVELPKGAELVSCFPKEKLINQTPQGDVIIIEGYSPEHNGSIPVIIEYRLK